MLYIVRVELNGANEQSYTILHTAMREAGFSRQIVIGGTQYHLPTAEYSYSGNGTLTQVRDVAKTAASSTGLNFEILATAANDCTGYLIPVR